MTKIVAMIMAIISYFAAFFGIDMQSGITVYTDISYGGEKQIMDIYVPEEACRRDNNSVILYLHAGSWKSGSKEELDEYCRKIAGMGYVAATMDYSLITDLSMSVTAFTMLDEIEMALQKIKDFSDEQGLNITTGALGGFSAGAHLAMLYSYSRASDSPIKLRFVINQSGPSDLHPEAWAPTYTKEAILTLAGLLAGKTITVEDYESGKAEDVINSVSPVAYVNKKSLPTLMGYGDLDLMVPSGNKTALLEKLQNKKVPHTCISYPNSGHGLWFDDESDVQFWESLEDFCKVYFGY